MEKLKLIECPRDAMQGIQKLIPTHQKVKYINALLRVGFETIDFGSFVSEKSIPQLSDTKEVLKKLDLSNTKSKLLAIIANLRGAEEASVFDEITFLGFPFSVSEEFQKRNTNATMEEALSRIEEIQKVCVQRDKQLIIYVSMAFGNPYGEPWNAEIVIKWVKRLAELGVRIIALSDTVGVSNPENITYLFSQLIPENRGIEFGAHLHSKPDSWEAKIHAAYESGCMRFDSAVKGIGGCPMADDALVGNIATENLLLYFKSKEVPLDLDLEMFSIALTIANETFV